MGFLPSCGRNQLIANPALRRLGTDPIGTGFQIAFTELGQIEAFQRATKERKMVQPNFPR